MGTGYSDFVLAEWRARLDSLAAQPPMALLYAGDPLDTQIHCVRPELVIEVKYTAWSGTGRVRHPVYLGLRENKAAADVVRQVAEPEALRMTFKPRRWKVPIPPRRYSYFRARHLASAGAEKGAYSGKPSANISFRYRPASPGANGLA